MKTLFPKPGPKNVISLDEEQTKKIESNSQIFYRSLNKSLRDERFSNSSCNYLEGKKLLYLLLQQSIEAASRAAGRTARIVSALAPDEVEKDKCSFNEW